MESLPEDCISHILSLTTPADACRLSLVSTTFLSAAESNVVWDKFLPSDCQHLISRSNVSSLSFATNKNLYLRLCDSNLLIDDGKKSFWLDKLSGKKCYMIAARELGISWGDDLRYWKWISLPQSRFMEVAMLVVVWWLEIRGKIRIDMLSPGTKYAAYLVFKLTRDPPAYGFVNLPVETSVGIYGKVDDSTSTRIVELELDPDGLMEEFPEIPLAADDRYPKQRKDGWMEIELGEYLNEGGGGQDDEELEMTVMEVKIIKGGLLVQGIEIRPEHTSSSI